MTGPDSSAKVHTERAALSADEGAPVFAVEVFGMRIGIDWRGVDLGADITTVLPPGWKPIPPEALHGSLRLTWLTAETSPVSREGYHWFDERDFKRFAPTAATAVDHFESVIEHYVAEHSPTLLFIHAGVVAWRGSAVVLPGQSRVGKSTLVTALVNAGATYYSDEFAVLDSDGIVYPYPRRVSQREGPYGAAGRVDLSHRAPTGEPGRAGIPIGLVLLTRYEAEGSRRCVPLAPAAAMMAMSQHVVAIRRRPGDTLAILKRIGETVPVVEGTRGDARNAAELILASMDAVAEEAFQGRAAMIARHLAGG